MDSVRFERLSIRMEEKMIIRNLHASISARCCTVILGPGGSGKSTLFMAIAGRLGGEFFSIRGNVRLKDQKVRLLEQNPINDFSLSPGAFFAMRGFNYTREVEDCWCKHPGFVQSLLALETQPLSAIAKQYHRIIAFTLAQAGDDYDLLLLDEPEVKVEELMPYLINRINDIKNKKTVMVNTHHMFFARSIADKMMVLFYGKLKEYASVSDFFQSENPDVQYIIKMGC